MIFQNSIMIWISQKINGKVVAVMILYMDL